MSLPHETVEQCKLCPAKLWSNADFAPQNRKAFILCLEKSQSLHTLPHKIMEQCKLRSAISWRHNFRGQNNNLKLDFILFFLPFFVNQCYFRNICNHWDNFLMIFFVSQYSFKIFSGCYNENMNRGLQQKPPYKGRLSIHTYPLFPASTIGTLGMVTHNAHCTPSQHVHNTPMYD